MTDIRELIESAWQVFQKEYPKTKDASKAYKAAWMVGYYYSFAPFNKSMRQRIEELLMAEEKELEKEAKKK